MPLWGKILIVAVLGIGLSIGAYQYVDLKLDQEHERYIRGLVVIHSKPTAETEDAAVDADERIATSTEDTTTSTEAAISIFTQGEATAPVSEGVSGRTEDTSSRLRELSIEIGVVTLEDVEFRVGESWMDEETGEVFTVTKIIQTPTRVELYYETEDETEYVFTLEKTDDGGYSIDGAEDIVLSIDTDPDDTGQGLTDDGQLPPSNDTATSTTTDSSDSSNQDTDNNDTNQTNNDTSNTNDDDDPVYVVVDTSSPTSTDNGGDDDPEDPADTNPDPVDDDEPEDPAETTPTSTAPTSTDPIINTTPSTTDDDAQPYNDGTYQYKANPQFVPYTPPLYDRNRSEEVGVDS